MRNDITPSAELEAALTAAITRNVDRLAVLIQAREQLRQAFSKRHETITVPAPTNEAPARLQ
jgi:hypothetical protein